MTLYFIGLGLYDMLDISLRGLDIIRRAEKIYLERYTAILHTSVEEMEKFFGKKIYLADREMVENKGDNIVEEAKNKEIAFLVVGDPFGATTHIDLFLRARKQKVRIEVVHNASILTAIGVVGLELYKYGKTTSIVFPDEGWMPKTPYEVIKKNKEMGLHTLCLLDIKVSEPTKEDLLRGINKPQPPRFMTVNQAIKVLLELEEKHKEGVIKKDTIMIGCARLGGTGEEPKIIAGTPEELIKQDFGKPMHSLIIPSEELHHIEEEMIEQWRIR